MHTAGSAPTPGLWRICATLIGIYIVLETAYVAVPDETLLQILDLGLVRPVVWLLQQLHAEDGIRAIGNRLVSSQVDFSVVRGCDGSGFFFLLTAAIFAFPVTWRSQLVGVLMAAGLTYLLNLLRLLTLYEVQRSHPQWFVPVHVYWAPGVLLAAGTLFFLIWMQRVHAVSFKP